MQQYVLGMIEDISGQKEAETRYKDAPIGLCTLDTNLRYVHVNEVLAQVNGVSVEEHLGRTIREVVSDVGAGVEQQLRRVIDTGEPILGGTVEAETPAHPGVKRHFRHDYYPNRSDDGAITGVSCIVQEFTELKRAKEQLHEYERQLRTLASEISLAEERERRRIAAELHDRIGQSLALSRIKLGALREAVAAGGPVRDLDEVCGIVDRTIQDTRSLVCELSPPLLYELGLEAALEWLGERTSEQFGYTCEVQDDHRPKPLDDDVAVVLFQAVRELLFNAGKHARASRVQVTLSADGPTIKVEVEDDGIGFDASLIKVHSSNGIGFGLFSIRERLVHLGGRVAIWSAPGSGARITLHAPLRTEEA